MGFPFCRGPDLGHSAKAIFAEGRPSATRDPRQWLLTEGRTLGRETPSVKAHLCREPGPRQRRGARRCWSRVTAALGVRICRGPGVKPSAKHCRRSDFAEGPPACPRQCPSLPRVWLGPSANFFYPCFFLSVVHLDYFELHAKVSFILK